MFIILIILWDEIIHNLYARLSKAFVLYYIENSISWTASSYHSQWEGKVFIYLNKLSRCLLYRNIWLFMYAFSNRWFKSWTYLHAALHLSHYCCHDSSSNCVWIIDALHRWLSRAFGLLLLSIKSLKSNCFVILAMDYLFGLLVHTRIIKVLRVKGLPFCRTLVSY